MMKAAALLVGTAAVALACNGGPSTDPDCQNTDLGSCGTACCKLAFTFPVGTTPDSVKTALVKAVGNGGPDNRFAWTTTADGTFGVTDDMIKTYGPAAYPFHYLGQAYHSTPIADGKLVTSGPYRDTVNFLIYEDVALQNRTSLRAFSVSEINGALGDNGMNYKAIMLAVREITNVDASLTWQMSHVDDSCPAKKH
eukprot:TRINITY_DN58237_c0_g1_i1.p1 TRINITY_DN58237_c0_g1~~TRINITY_DN58237_c0_g1_i1.p1  ORF type:complete len:196 (+),score=70.90 TRINITY_DN58237_c0_g1_i1:75-662(+)